MDITQDKAKLFVRIIGIFFVLIGFSSLVSNSIKWFGGKTVILTCAQPVYLLMLVGGGLLIALRQGGFEIIFVILRLYVFLGAGAIMGGIIAKQINAIIFGIIILILAISLIIFLSRSNVQSLFDKKE